MSRVALGNGMAPWAFFRTVADVMPQAGLRENCRWAWIDFYIRLEHAEHIAAGMGVTPHDLLDAAVYPPMEIAMILGPDIVRNMVAAYPDVGRMEKDGPVDATTSSLHFCPHCLADDAIPYFRRTWRLRMHRYCLEHEVRLSYRCPECSHAPRPHARKEIGPVHLCQHCECDLRTSPAAKATTEEVERQFRVMEHLEKLLGNELAVTAMSCGTEIVETAVAVLHGDLDILHLHAHQTLSQPKERKRYEKSLATELICRLKKWR
jgi:hypothetical protein